MRRHPVKWMGGVCRDMHRSIDSFITPPYPISRVKFHTLAEVTRNFYFLSMWQPGEVLKREMDTHNYKGPRKE